MHKLYGVEALGGTCLAMRDSFQACLRSQCGCSLARRGRSARCFITWRPTGAAYAVAIPFLWRVVSLSTDVADGVSGWD